MAAIPTGCYIQQWAGFTGERYRWWAAETNGQFNPLAAPTRGVAVQGVITPTQGSIFRRKTIFRTAPETENFRFSGFFGFSDRKMI